MKRQLLIALLACGCGAVGAQTIYRCGNTYSERACADGTVVEAMRAPDPAEAAASRKETEREMKAATEMEKARLKEEAKPASVYIPKEKAEAPTKPYKVDVFTARAPGEKKKPVKKKKTA
jgi:hypothetical protein